MICVSIANSDFTHCLDLIKQYECIELRLDAADFTISQIKALISLSEKAIVTFRPGNADYKTRIQAMSAAILAGAYMIDVELDAPEVYRNELQSLAKSKACKLIISHHDYESTPSLESLKAILAQCYASGADIAKIACMVNSEGDNARLLSLYTGEGKKVILGMGELGRITRIAALYLGAEFSFASPDNGKITAAGQLSFSEFQAIQNILNLRKS
jgi:3-dehydroquinate dehydratase type I